MFGIQSRCWVLRTLFIDEFATKLNSVIGLIKIRQTLSTFGFLNLFFNISKFLSFYIISIKKTVTTHHMNLLFFLIYFNFLDYSLNKTCVTEGLNTLDPVVFTCAGKDIHNILWPQKILYSYKNRTRYVYTVCVNLTTDFGISIHKSYRFWFFLLPINVLSFPLSVVSFSFHVTFHISLGTPEMTM